MVKRKKGGWRGEPGRHAKAAKGIKTGRKRKRYYNRASPKKSRGIWLTPEQQLAKQRKKKPVWLSSYPDEGPMQNQRYYRNFQEYLRDVHSIPFNVTRGFHPKTYKDTYGKKYYWLGELDSIAQSVKYPGQVSSQFVSQSQYGNQTPYNRKRKKRG